MWTFNLKSDQSLPLELAKHDPLDRPEVAVGVCIALRVLLHTFLSKWTLLELRGWVGGGGIEDLMVLPRNLPQASKSAIFPNKLAQAAPHEVFVYHLHP